METDLQVRLALISCCKWDAWQINWSPSRDSVNGIEVIPIARNHRLVDTFDETVWAKRARRLTIRKEFPDPLRQPRLTLLPTGLSDLAHADLSVRRTITWPPSKRSHANLRPPRSIDSNFTVIMWNFKLFPLLFLFLFKKCRSVLFNGSFLS